MRRFNPEKELKKIQHGNKSKIIFGMIALLLIIAIGSSYALYQVRYSKRIIYTKVGNFYQNDVVLSVYIDGEKKTEPNSFPSKESGKIFSHVTCKNGGTGYFDNTKWELNLKTTEQDRCDVYFVTGNLPNEPELFQGMIPVTFSDTGIMYVADTNSDWYNYQDHRWANAVLVDASNPDIKDKYFDGENQLRKDIAGIQVPMEEVLQMYVWIPRYKYQLFNVGLEGVPKQIINIKFENDTETTGEVKCKYINENNGEIKEECTNLELGNWYTHPAFTFKGTTDETGTELKGIWVGKFEPSDPTDLTGITNVNKVNEITILPNKTSKVRINIKTVFDASRNIELENSTKYNLNSNEIDTHTAKNIEWGAMAYLTYSIYGIFKPNNQCNIDGMSFEECTVWFNNTSQGTEEENASSVYGKGGSATGCVAESLTATYKCNSEAGTSAKCDNDKQWNTGGIKASTTGNMYGIYDTAGGAADYVMGGIANTEGILDTRGSSFVQIPNSIYFDLYSYNTVGNKIENGHYGDAGKEIKVNNTFRGWDNASIGTIISDTNGRFLKRGNTYWNFGVENVLSKTNETPGGTPYTTFRVVLTAQDGEE